MVDNFEGTPKEQVTPGSSASEPWNFDNPNLKPGLHYDEPIAKVPAAATQLMIAALTNSNGHPRGEQTEATTYANGHPAELSVNGNGSHPAGQEDEPDELSPFPYSKKVNGETRSIEVVPTKELSVPPVAHTPNDSGNGAGAHQSQHGAGVSQPT